MLYNNWILNLILFSFFSCQAGTNNKSGESSISSAFTQGVLEEQLELRQVEGLVYFRYKPFTGTSLKYYYDDTLAESISYLDGKRHGVHKKWFEDGKLSFEAHYEKGKRNGTSKTWWGNGQLKSLSNYAHGIPHGMQLQWYQSGAKFKRIQLNQGVEEGLQQSWRENGKIYNNYEAKNGRIFGLKRANLCYELEEEIVQFKY